MTWKNYLFEIKKSYITVGFKMVGDIDLSSNQMLEFLENFLNENV